MATSVTLTGAALKLYINGTPFGVATGIQYTSSQGRKTIGGLDQLTPIEIAPGVDRITGQITCVRKRLDGGLEGRGVASRAEDRLLEKYISIVLVDRLTDRIVFRCDNAVIDNQTWNVQAKGIVEITFNFTGISWGNEYDS